MHGELVDVSRRVKIVCLGDSITEGCLVTPETRWTALLANRLGEAYEVVNCGLAARCVLEAGDYPICRESVYQEALDARGDVVLIALGTNDSKQENWPWKHEFEDNYRRLIEDFRKGRPGVVIYCLLAVPSQEPWLGGISRERIKHGINPMISRVAGEAGCPVIDLYSVLEGREDLLEDGVHPGAQGHVLLADYLAHVLVGELSQGNM